MPQAKGILLTNVDPMGYHALPENSERLAEHLRTEADIEIAVTDELERLADPALRELDFVLNNTFRVELTPEQEAGLLAFVEAGGGFLGLHTATITFAPNFGYHFMIGGRFKGHGPFREFLVEVRDDAHPITRGMADFRIEDELYVCARDPHMRVLATAAEHGVDEPIVWVRDYGAGRVVYNALGHDVRAYTNPHFLELTRRAALWVAGRLD